LEDLADEMKVFIFTLVFGKTKSSNVSLLRMVLAYWYDLGVLCRFF